MSDDIIGTPVERVIPEGWHLVRDGVIQEDDAVGDVDRWQGSHGAIGSRTNANGRWLNMSVIRRNAPEPSVEELKKEIEELKKVNDALEAQFRGAGHVPYLQRMQELAARAEKAEAKVAELEAENEKLRGRIAHLGIQFDQYKAWNATAGKELKAKDAEIKRLKADVHMWSEANQANLARADAADAKMCSGFQAEVDRLKAHAEQLERDLKASQARFCVLTQEADRMAAKLVAVRKVMEGA